MITLSTFIKILKLWLTLFSYWVINTLFHAYPTRDEDGDYYYLVGCLFLGSVLGLITCGVMNWFDIDINFAPPVSSIDVSNLSSDLDLNELKIQKQKELEELQKEEEEAIYDIYWWLATTLVVYYLVFSNCY